MKGLIEKLRIIETQTSKEKGDYELFGVFLREDSSNKWDIVVAAPWISVNKENALKYLAGIVQQSLSPEDLLLLSKIVIIDGNNPALPELQSISVEHGDAEIKDSNLFGLQIRHAFIITSKRLQPV